MRPLPATVALAALFALGGCASAPGPRPAPAPVAMSLQAFAELQQRAAVAYAEGNAPAATALYAELVRRAPDDVQAWRRLGNLDLLQNRLDDALLAYAHALQLGGGNAMLWHNLAVIRLHQAQQALAQVQAQPAGPGQNRLRTRSASAERALDRVLLLLTPSPASPAAATAGGNRSP